MKKTCFVCKENEIESKDCILAFLCIECILKLDLRAISNTDPNTNTSVLIPCCEHGITFN